MPKTHVTGLIRVVKTPEGIPPDWVRSEWVGAVLSCEPRFQINENRGGRLEAIVPHLKAIEALEKISPKAAQWWRDSGKISADGYFGFGESEVEVIDDSVSYPRIIEVPGEAEGSIDR